MLHNLPSAEKHFMEQALKLALRAEGRTSPNPLVGCVIVRNGQIIGEGFHAKAGTPHAEINALKAAGDLAKGSDVYVTLEPCSHYGRTPPCADALIAAGVKRVVVAMEDPNPLVSGQGIQKLREAGIIVETGLLAEQARKINEPFLKAISTKLPFILYKCALTLDGKTAVDSGDSKWITSEESRAYVHHLRNIYDVVMVGSRTILSDNSQLTCRIEGGRDPVRLIVDGSLLLPMEAKVLSTTSSSPCIIATTLAADHHKLEYFRQRDNVEIWQYDSDRVVPLPKVMADITQRGWNSVLLEGGGTLAGKMLEAKLIDKIEFMMAPKLAGSGSSPFSGFHLSKMEDAVKIDDLEVCHTTGDYRLTGYIDYRSDK